MDETGTSLETVSGLRAIGFKIYTVQGLPRKVNRSHAKVVEMPKYMRYNALVYGYAANSK